MSSAPSVLNHPTFGKCELIPSLLAVKWKQPVRPEALAAALSALAVEAATVGESKNAGPGTRDPAAGAINQSTMLTWAKAKQPTETALSATAAGENVEWAGPVYRASGAENGTRSYFGINPTVIILTAAGASAIDLAAIESTATIDQVRTKLLHGYVVYTLPKGNALDVAAALLGSAAIKNLPNAVSLENVPYLSPTCCGCGGGDAPAPTMGGGNCAPTISPLVPNDPLFASQWGLQRINAPSAWPISQGDPNVVIAVLDQGVELAHPDLNLLPVSYSTITHTNNGGPVGNHGTACAGIIASKTNDALGAAGLAGQCRVLAIATNFADTEVAEGLYYAADNGARVVSMSFGVYASWMTWNFPLIEAALQYCQDKNVVLVAATGNENQAISRFPGSDPRTIGVGGSNRGDVRKSIGDTSIENWWGACYGPDVDVVAPCLEIPTTDRLGGAGYTPTDYNLRFNGTSAATPHVAALAGLILSVDGTLSHTEVRKIISETADKINAGGYAYLPTAGKPHGTWYNEVGYGRINVERALLVACAFHKKCGERGPCAVALAEPGRGCASPGEPAWRPGGPCLYWPEIKTVRLTPAGGTKGELAVRVSRAIIEFQMTYEHSLCLSGKQQGPLVFTTTLLPGETVKIYHSERFRQITSVQQRYSVQTTFLQYLSLIHSARTTGQTNTLNDVLSNSNLSGGGGASLDLGIFSASLGGGASSAETDHTQVSTQSVSDQFNQSVQQSSQMTQAERSIVVSTYEDKESIDVTARTLHNANECRAVTYFVRRVMELYTLSTRVTGIAYRVIAPNVAPDWHSIENFDGMSAAIRAQVLQQLGALPTVGQVIKQPHPIPVPTDGVVYDPELAHCCSCEPERQAAIALKLEKEKAEALTLCYAAQERELEIERRRLLLKKGILTPFDTVAVAATAATQ